MLLLQIIISLTYIHSGSVGMKRNLYSKCTHALSDNPRRSTETLYYNVSSTAFWLCKLAYESTDMWDLLIFCLRVTGTDLFSSRYWMLCLRIARSSERSPIYFWTEAWTLEFCGVYKTISGRLQNNLPK